MLPTNTSQRFSLPPASITVYEMILLFHADVYISQLDINCCLVCRLIVYPGYQTVIAPYDGGLMLNADVVHKVLRTETVLDIMYGLYERYQGQAFRDQCIRALIGASVMTRWVTHSQL